MNALVASAPGKYWLPPDISADGHRIDSIINFTHYFMVILFVAWGIFFVYCLFKFRQRAGHRATYEPVKAKMSKYGEVGVVIVEFILLVFFSIPIWHAYRIEPPKPDEDPMTIRVIAQQFAWNVHYPGPDGKFGPTDPKLIDEQLNPIGLNRDDETAKDDVVLLNNMHVPIDKPVVVRVTTKDVIHSFWLPYLRVKQDTIPGMEIPVWFTAKKTSDQVRQEVTRTYSIPTAGSAREQRFLTQGKTRIVMDDYTDSSGNTIVAAGDGLSDEVLAQLRAAGHDSVALAPFQPMEIHCAQLCGLNHYSMRGFFIAETQAEFDKFMQAEIDSLQGGEDDFWGE